MCEMRNAPQESPAPTGAKNEFDRDNYNTKVCGLTINRIVELLKLIKRANTELNCSVRLEAGSHSAEIFITYFWTKKTESTSFCTREWSATTEDRIGDDRNLELAEAHLKMLLRMAKYCTWMQNPYREEDEKIDTL